MVYYRKKERKKETYDLAKDSNSLFKGFQFVFRIGEKSHSFLMYKVVNFFVLIFL